MITITDVAGGGSGAMASAIIGAPLTGGIKKFQDLFFDLKNVIATPHTTTFPNSDYYEIALVQYTGSRFNYVIVGSNADANRLTKILLLPLIAEKPSDQVVNTAAVQQPSALRPEGNDIEEAVQLSENPQASPLPIRAQQQMLQQRRQMVIQQSQNQ